MSGPISTPSPVQKASRREAWERWVIIWHLVFYASLAIPTVLALLSGELNLSKSTIFALSLALGTWYGLIVIWLAPKTQWKYQIAWTIIYLVGAVLLWFPLARTHWAYFITASSFYGMMWGILPFGLAVLGNVILTAVIIWIQALNLGRPVTLSTELFLIGAVVIGWAAILALWMRTIMRESAARKRLIEQLEATQENLAAVERQAGVLEERQRVAGEIHDTLAQGFTSIVMQLEAADQALPGDVHAVQDHIHKARETARGSLKEARRLVLALQPESLEEASLGEALRREAARWALDSGVKTVFSLTGDSLTLDPQTEVTLLRAMQESLTNVQKHAKAQNVNITLSYMADRVALDVQDDGQGFDPQIPSSASSSGTGGLGLGVMQQRVEQVGGEVIVESALGQGTTLVVQIPIEVDPLEEESLPE